jgi:hypothetical protein
MGASHTMDKWEVQFAAEFAQNTPPRNVGGPAFPGHVIPSFKAVAAVRLGPSWDTPWARMAIRQPLDASRFVPNRLSNSLPVDSPAAPTLFPAFLGILAAAAHAVPAAALVAAEPERPEQIGLRPPDQANALAPWNRQPFFERAPAGKASLAVVHGPLLSSFILPRESGERGPRRCTVEGARAASIFRRRRWHVESDVPPPCCAWSPSPAIAGGYSDFPQSRPRQSRMNKLSTG